LQSEGKRAKDSCGREKSREQDPQPAKVIFRRASRRKEKKKPTREWGGIKGRQIRRANNTRRKER